MRFVVFFLRLVVSFVTFVDIFFAFSGLVQKYKRPVFLQYQLEVLDFF